MFSQTLQQSRGFGNNFRCGTNAFALITTFTPTTSFTSFTTTTYFTTTTTRFPDGSTGGNAPAGGGQVGLTSLGIQTVLMPCPVLVTQILGLSSFSTW